MPSQLLESTLQFYEHGKRNKLNSIFVELPVCVRSLSISIFYTVLNSAGGNKLNSQYYTLFCCHCDVHYCCFNIWYRILPVKCLWCAVLYMKVMFVGLYWVGCVLRTKALIFRIPVECKVGVLSVTQSVSVLRNIWNKQEMQYFYEMFIKNVH